MAKRKLPKNRIKVTLDDALFISEDKVYVDLHTPLGDLLLAFDAENFSALVGEVANSLDKQQRPKLVEAR